MVRKNSKLADMSGATVQSYKPPPQSARDPDSVFRLDLRWYEDYPHLELRVRQAIYRKMIVDFSIELHWREELDGPWYRICRVDTSHGTVHWHQYNRNSDAEKKEVLSIIPLKTGWNYVNHQYHDIYDYLLDNIEMIMERWKA